MKIQPIRPLTLLAAGALLSACFSTVPVPDAPGPTLEVKPGAFPHDVLGEVLAAHVDEAGRVDYRSLAEDRGPLLRYVEAIGRISPHSDPQLFPGRDHELAYWINAYNALVLYAVTERPEMRSVNDDAKGFFYFTEYVLGQETLSLYELENDVVRGEFDEHRIHFALNCASGGCPELPREPFLPERLDAQLEREAEAFCQDPEKVKVEGGEVKVSKIFEWYDDDFEGGPIAFCERHGRDLPDDPEVEYLDYDWRLNAQPGRALFER